MAALAAIRELRIRDLRPTTELQPKGGGNVCMDPSSPCFELGESFHFQRSQMAAGSVCSLRLTVMKRRSKGINNMACAEPTPDKSSSRNVSFNPHWPRATFRECRFSGVGRDYFAILFWGLFRWQNRCVGGRMHLRYVNPWLKLKLRRKSCLNSS
jgi:hypothetical protein